MTESKLRKVRGPSKVRRRYTLDELLGEAKRAPPRNKDTAWVAGAPVGRELV